jgi:hypothetical protein
VARRRAKVSLPVRVADEGQRWRLQLIMLWGLARASAHPLPATANAVA